MRWSAGIRDCSDSVHYRRAVQLPGPVIRLASAVALLASPITGLPRPAHLLPSPVVRLTRPGHLLARPVGLLASTIMCLPRQVAGSAAADLTSIAELS